MGSVQKYENVLVSGIISLRERSASSFTVSLEFSVAIGILHQDCNRAMRGNLPAVRKSRPAASRRTAARLKVVARTVLVSAGEASGDLYASLLVAELRRLWPAAEFFGCAGPRMPAAGVHAV